MAPRNKFVSRNKTLDVGRTSLRLHPIPIHRILVLHILLPIQLLYLSQPPRQQLLLHLQLLPLQIPLSFAKQGIQPC